MKIVLPLSSALLSLLLACNPSVDADDTMEPGSTTGGAVDPTTGGTNPPGTSTTENEATTGGSTDPTDATGVDSTGSTGDGTTGDQCMLADDNVACDAKVVGGLSLEVAGPMPVVHAEGPVLAAAPRPAVAPMPCDVYAQDCPEGEKCSPYASDGGNVWNANGCFPVDADPDLAGESCEIYGSGTSGEDSCEPGSFCRWDVSLGGAVCERLCGCSSANPVCGENEKCFVSNGGALPVCSRLCDPLAAEPCADGQVCVLSNNSENNFTCITDGSDAGGQFQDPCKYANDCDPGYGCSYATTVPGGCNGSQYCCNQLCDLAAPSCPEGGHCVAYVLNLDFDFEPAVCLENVGFCFPD